MRRSPEHHETIVWENIVLASRDTVSWNDIRVEIRATMEEFNRAMETQRAQNPRLEEQLAELSRKFDVLEALQRREGRPRFRWEKVEITALGDPESRYIWSLVSDEPISYGEMVRIQSEVIQLAEKMEGRNKNRPNKRL